MSNFARIINGVVTEVIVADQDFINSLETKSEWVQTSYNTRGGVHYDPNTGQPSADQTKALRKNFAGIGFSYDYLRDAFIPPKMFPSMIFNEQSCTWVFPVPYPTDGKFYVWDEITTSWIEK